MTGATLPEWLRPTATAAPTAPSTIRAAFLGRTSTDEQQDPTLSIPWQFSNCERALLPNMEIVLHFYDVETSRKELAQRGSSTAWKKFDIPLRRDGGIADLLAEALSPDRRFDVVICESIDRIARFTYQGTKIEHDLELAGVPLLAADEPIIGHMAWNRRSTKDKIHPGKHNPRQEWVVAAEQTHPSWCRSRPSWPP